MEYPIQSAARIPRSIWIAILALDLISRLTVALRPLEYIDALSIPDDAYYSLTVARSIAHEFAPLYGGSPTNGIQPLYVFLMAPVFWFTGESAAAPVHAALVLLTLFDLLALFFLIRIVANRSRSIEAPLLAAALWIFNPYVLRTTMNGLETMIAFALMMASLHAYYALRSSVAARADPRRSLIVGALLGLAILARIDHAILAFALAAAHVLDGLARKRFRSAVVECLFMALAAAAVNLPWLAYSQYFTGDIYPISGRAVRQIGLLDANHDPTLANVYRLSMLVAGGRIYESNAATLYLLAFLLIATPLIRGRLALGEVARWFSDHGALVLFVVLLLCAYIVHVLLRVFYFRYFFALVAPLLIAIAALFDGALGGVGAPRHRKLVAGFVILGATIALAAQPRLGSFPKLTDMYLSKSKGSGYLPPAKWARDYFEQGAVIGASQSGALGYFCDNMTVYNLDGVVNKAAYEAIGERRLMAYIKESEIEYIIGWGLNIQQIMRDSSGYKDGDLISMGRLGGVQTWGFDWFVYRVNYDE